jgi:hypothetical protein
MSGAEQLIVAIPNSILTFVEIIALCFAIAVMFQAIRNK